MNVNPTEHCDVPVKCILTTPMLQHITNLTQHTGLSIKLYLKNKL